MLQVILLRLNNQFDELLDAKVMQFKQLGKDQVKRRQHSIFIHANDFDLIFDI